MDNPILTSETPLESVPETLPPQETYAEPQPPRRKYIGRAFGITFKDLFLAGNFYIKRDHHIRPEFDIEGTYNGKPYDNITDLFSLANPTEEEGGALRVRLSNFLNS